MTFFALIMAAVSGALFHFSFRKSLDGGGRSSVFLMLQCFFASLLMVFLNVKPSNFFLVDWNTICLGTIEGILYVGMMVMMGEALKKGPPGLTVATLNSAAVIPAILMGMIFGAGLGHGYTLWNGIGSLLVVVGLFLAARSTTSFTASKSTWALCAFLAFAGHSIYLTVFQWRALLLTDIDLPYLSLDLQPETSHWFQPLIFLSAGLIQLVIYLMKERTWFTKREIVWASTGGIGNAFCTFGLIWAAQIASSSEKAMIFPIAGVLSILLCGLWGKFLYKERISVKGAALCLSGIVLGTVDWT